MPEVLFAAEDLTLTIGRQILFDHTDFAISSGEKVALVGRNGCGKSTLMRIIAGSESPSENSRLTRMRDLRCAILPQEFTLDDRHSIAENVRSGLQFIYQMLKRYDELPVNSNEHMEIEHFLTLHDLWQPEVKLQVILDKLRLSDIAEKSCASLSGGEKRRVALARAIISSPDLLLLDEPTNHLDIETVEWVEDFINSEVTTALFVTHDRCFLDRIATRVVELDHGKFYSYNGSYADFLSGKAEREEKEDIFEAKRQSFLRSEIDWVRRSPKARLKRNQGRMKRFEEISAIAKPLRDADMELLIPYPPRLGNKTVTLKNVTKSFGSRQIIRDFSFEFAPGSRIGLVGPNGIGKSTLIKIITGELPPDSGSCEVATTVQFNLIDQTRMVLDESKTVAEEISEGLEHVYLGTEKVTVWTYLKRFLFEDERIKTQIKYLSGGEKARLALAKILKRGGNFLILDEPTNDLDLSSLRILEEALAVYPGCVLTVSHDRYFLNRVCDGILSFSGGGELLYTPGDYDYAREKLREKSSASGKDVPVRKNPPPQPVKAKPKKLSYKEQKELDGMEEAIMAAEEHVSNLENIFSDPDFYAKYGTKTAELQDELESAKAHCAKLYDRWEELLDLASQLREN
ncbi:MAG: ABC-F family ATP-binding cassette domain-containing protein [Lentisphaeria bacterium]|nr:ABC-F family ATP-binding cassette domain-containing protein [Lentisphaeria bacterium]